jgi:uncharacterized membrane protein YphA (DoxX/SURF4 family)
LSDTPNWGLVLIRIVVGFLLLVAGWHSLRAGDGETIVAQSSDAYAASPELVRSFGENVLLKHPRFFGQLIVIAQIVCGLCLFLGMLTRPAGFIGALLFTYAYFTVPEAQQPLCVVLAVCCFACGLSRAGRRSGADVFLDERLPRWLTWTRGAQTAADE